MNETPENPDISQPLQFETAEGVKPGQVSCGVCGAALVSEYHELCGQPVCASCRAKAERQRESDKRRILPAALYGLGGALLGGLAYWIVFKFGIQLGIVAIGVGWLAGKGVMKGCNNVGGRRFQILAVALTYLGITLSYGALIVEEVLKNAKSGKELATRPARKGIEERPTAPVDPAHQPLAEPPKPADGGNPAVSLVYLFFVMLAAPFLGGLDNIIGIVIVAIGLWEAWRRTREVPFWTGGPFELGGGGASPHPQPMPGAPAA